MSDTEELSKVIVVDPDPASRNLAEELEDELDCQVIAMDSMEFDAEASEDVLEAGAFIICWNLGIRAGADLVEEIRAHPTISDRKVIVAMENPTRTAVQWAYSAGADAVCCLPYDPEQVATRVQALVAAESAQAAA